MERLSSQPEPTIQHFSHPHPLQLSYHQSQQNLYLAAPTYPEGFFKCDACGKQGNGFSYHCKSCGFDLHILCASMPLSVAHHQYHHHQLNLQFSPPYANKRFSCDICTQAGSDHWLYRCDSCNFDAHLTCAWANHPPPPATVPVQTPIQPITIQPYQITPTAPIQVIRSPLPVPIQPIIQLPQYQPTFPVQAPGAPYGARPLQTYHQPTFPVQAPGAPYGARPLQTYPQNNNMITNQIIQGLVGGVAQAAGQALFQGFMGGGDGGASDGSSFSGDQ